jgi:hypothetical protein
LVHIILGSREFKFVQIKGQILFFLRGDDHKNVKMGWDHLKIFFSRTTGPNLTRHGINHPGGGGEFKFVQMKGIAPL